MRSTPELVNHVQRDRDVRDRYMRHFAMTESEVVAYFKTLHPATLQSDGVYRIYSVPEGGILKAHTEKLRKGTKVFALADGTPALIMKCGNPLSLGPKSAVSVNNLLPVLVDRVPAPKEFDIELLQADVMPGVVAVVEPLVPNAFAEEQPATEGKSNIPIVGSSRGILPILLGAGGLIFVDRGGHHPPPVPEPAGVLALGVGCLGLAYRLRRRR